MTTKRNRGEIENKARRRHLRDAAQALSDLNIFHAVVAILESGAIHTPSHRPAEFIIRHCKKASADCLDRYDAACSNLGVINR